MNNNTNHSIYSRLLNQEIDSNKLHKFGVNGSYFLPVGSTGVQAKSLNSRVAELTGVNTPSIIPLGSLVPNGSSKHQSIINNKNTHTHSSTPLGTGEEDPKGRGLLFFVINIGATIANSNITLVIINQ